MPKWIGYEIESLDYTFIQDVIGKIGWLSSDLTIKTMTSSIELKGLARGDTGKITNAIRARIPQQKPPF
jgi:hypothetical protein